MVKKRNIWIVIDHPVQILMALGLSLHYRDRYQTHLIVSKHPYWSGIKINQFSKYFTSITKYEPINFSWLIPRELVKIFYLKKELGLLRVKQNDTFFMLSNKAFIENALISIFPKVKKISFLPQKFKNKKFESYQETIISKIWRALVYPLVGLQPIKYLKNRATNYYDLVYLKPDIFNFSFFYQPFSKKARLKKDEIYELSPIVVQKLKLRRKGAKSKVIIFFGDSMNKNKFSQPYIDFINKCLRYIESNFQNYELIYKRHPNDKYEYQSITLGKFRPYSGPLTTELYCLLKVNQIKACFSVSSSSILSAHNLGIRGYYFYKMHKGYNYQQQALLDFEVGDVHPDSFILNFKDKPLLYKSSISTSRIARQLKKIDEVI